MPALADFRGEWCLDRRVEDHHGTQSGCLSGRARFSPATGGLRYEEEGVLELGSGAKLAARQAHLWHASPPEIVVRFPDGRDFHRFNSESVASEGRHICGADLYLVRYDFADWPRWRVTWTVSGPRKDYTMRSAYVGRQAEVS